MEIKDKDEKPIVVEVCTAADPKYLAVFNADNYIGLDFKVEDAPALAYAILKETGYAARESESYRDKTKKVVTFVISTEPSKEITELAHTLYGEDDFPEHPDDKQYFYEMAERAIKNGWAK